MPSGRKKDSLKKDRACTHSQSQRKGVNPLRNEQAYQ
jgi:hypothetical protein